MVHRFRLVATSGYQRDIRTTTRRNPALVPLIEHLLDIRELDPYNVSHQYPIKKLVGVKPNKGQWRIRSGSTASATILLDRMLFYIHSATERKRTKFDDLHEGQNCSVASYF